MGRIEPGFRFVYPLFKDNKHIGSVETSFNIEAFSKKLSKLFDVRTTYIISKDVATKELFNNSKRNYIQSIESDNYVTLKRYLRCFFRGK
jgi:hypothetical protein